jgi:hypothetical protein
MTSAVFSGNFISTYMDSETIKNQNEVFKSNPLGVRLPDFDVEDSSLMNDIMIDPFSNPDKEQDKLKKYFLMTDSAPLMEAYAHLKMHQKVPKLLSLHQTTEADFEKPLIYSPIPFPDPYVLTSNSKRNKLLGEFFETNAGFHFLRLFMHLKIEKFHYSNKNMDTGENDIFRVNNIAQYCPKFLKGHGAEERLHCSKQSIRLAKELDENSNLLEGLNQVFSDIEMMEEVSPKFEAYRNQSDVFETNF